jgi:hypothetical protein
MDLPLLRGQAISFARVEINHDPSATTLLEDEWMLEVFGFGKLAKEGRKSNS